MANYVKNILVIEGTEEEVSKCLENIKGTEEGALFDFNTVIPMPSSLDIVSGSLTDTGIRAYSRYIMARLAPSIANRNPYSLHTMDSLKDEEDYRSEHMVKKDEWDLGKKAFINQLLYGAPTWYEWRCENWGTKWNAADCEIKGADIIVFYTAWSPPVPVIEKLAECYPNLRFVHQWADEDIGSINCGERIYEHGEGSAEIVPDDHEGFARNIWDDDSE